MGVDCRVELAPDVRLQDVAEVIGILLGKPANYAVHDGMSMRYSSTEVEGVKTKASVVPECADIAIYGPTFLGAQHGGDDGARYFMYHFEDDGHIGPLVAPRCTALNIAMCVALAKFFGGRVVYNDCTDKKSPRYATPRRTNRPRDGQPWEDFEQAKSYIKPLTRADCLRYQRYAAYPITNE